jgi:methylated-DNA-[protein]-cysteine S-methyltransferase
LNQFHFPVGFGTLLVSWNSDELLTRIIWAENRLAVWQRARIPSSLLDLVECLYAYFYDGKPLGEIPWDKLDQSCWSDFQKQVYRAIAAIPHGETRTYGWVAARIGKAASSRAVGQALKKNPFPILIPCHRVFASTSMGGFMGVVDPSRVELQLKKKLISLEEEYRNPVFSFISLAPRALA